MNHAIYCYQAYILFIVKRLVLKCDDRLGLTQEVLTCLLKHRMNLQGIELLPDQLFLKMLDSPDEKTTDWQQFSLDLLSIKGIHAVLPVDLMPLEKEHIEALTLIECYPEAVASFSREGVLLMANPAFYNLFEIDESDPKPVDMESMIARECLRQIKTLIQGEQGQQVIHFNGQSLMADVKMVESPEVTQPTGAVIQFSRIDRIADQLVRWQNDLTHSFDRCIAESDIMQSVLQDAKNYALMDLPLLIQGETGTGKELVARACHHLIQSDGPFMALNCAALPDEMAEYELFGYADGAFSGAMSGGKPGLLELTHGGTLFLDAIDGMSSYLQVKLLRFLEEGCFRRVGAEQVVKVKVRIIAASQRDLLSLSQNKQFREDLLFRLNVLTLELPPLRKRKADIIPLAEHFIEITARRLNRQCPELTVRAMQALQRYNWPGNVRELENVILQVMSSFDRDKITTDQLKLPMLQPIPSESHELLDISYRQAVNAFEKQLIESLYPSFPSTRKLAKRLGLSHTAVAKKLRQFEIASE